MQANNNIVPIISWTDILTHNLFLEAADGDAYDLCRVSLVCRSCRSPVQQHLFKRVHFTAAHTGRSVQGFINFVRTHPILATQIRLLELQGRVPFPLPLLTLYILSHILLHIPNIATLDISSFQWESGTANFIPLNRNLRNFYFRAIFVRPHVTSPLHILQTVRICDIVRIYDIRHLAEPIVREELEIPVRSLQIVHDALGIPAMSIPGRRAVFTSVRELVVYGADLSHSLSVHQILLKNYTTLRSMALSFSKYQYCTLFYLES